MDTHICTWKVMKMRTCVRPEDTSAVIKIGPSIASELLVLSRRFCRARAAQGLDPVWTVAHMLTCGDVDRPVAQLVSVLLGLLVL